MSLYIDVTRELMRQEQMKEMFRFQGANSFEHFDIRTSKYNQDTKDNYIYLSSSIDHHKYFTIKRIRQMINRDLLKESPYKLSCKDIRDQEGYTYIKKLVLNSEKLKELYSIRLLCNKEALKLLKENSFKQGEKPVPRAVERVDRRVYGGGYGLSKDWKELLSYLTYFNSYQRIDRESINELISKMRRTGKVNQKDNIDFIVSNPNYYSLELSSSIESDFTKYKIMESLERILEEGSYNKESELGNYPTKTIKKVVDEYEKGKQKVLTLFDKYSK